jgi:hypothetical protein
MAYQDRPPLDKALPYVTISEQIALAPDPLEDGALGTVTETVAVDLWQAWKQQTAGQRLEDPTLIVGLIRGLHGARLQTIGSAKTYAVLVRPPTPRLLDEEDFIVHHAITCDVRREG